MIVNLFRHTQVLSVVSVFVLSITLWIIGYSTESMSSNWSSSPLFDLIFNPLKHYPILLRLFAGAIIFWEAILVNKLMVGQRIFSTNTFYPALFFVLLSSVATEYRQLSPSFVALLFVIVALTKIVTCYLENNTHTQVFESTFFLSVATLIHPPFMVFIPLSWIGMSIFSLGEWRYWVLSLLGILTPLVIWLSLGIYFGIPNSSFSNLFSFITKDHISSTFSRIDIVRILIYSSIVGRTFIEVLTSLRKKKIIARKSFILILWLLLFQGLYLLIDPSPYSSKLQILALPCSILISNYYYYKRTNFWLNLSLYLFIFGVLTSLCI